MAKQKFNLWVCNLGFGENSYSITDLNTDMTDMTIEYALVGEIEIEVDHSYAEKKLQAQKRLNKANKIAAMQLEMDRLENEL